MGSRLTGTFANMTRNGFINDLNQYNVLWIIGWSQAFNQFMEYYPSIFPRVAVIGEFSVYNNTLFKNNYFLFSSNNESQGTPLLFTPN